jgi:hypothetical protein
MVKVHCLPSTQLATHLAAGKQANRTAEITARVTEVVMRTRAKENDQ